ncbi:hypothetical protein S2091_4704 [Solimicrobium silvestre]|uniref:Uncharacterized protein n=1 Tax=Solimicrobium silvestre TaxID=2099400 RepID=A0A2S9GSA8_9BURK|nr:hypothetical protein S2091_4704 [Solimicrobium silvestre]
MSDPSGLDPKSEPVPGTNYDYRIDSKNLQPNQQPHAHIYDSKGNEIVVINKDGTGSHGSCPDKLPKNKKLIKFLLSKGFLLTFAGDLIFLEDLVNSVGRSVDPYNPYYYYDPKDVPKPGIVNL